MFKTVEKKNSLIMAHNIFKGLGIALITPFTSDGDVDWKSLKRLVEYQISNGADFLCILATTGETPCLSAEEKIKIKQLVVEVNNGRVPVLMGCGGNNTRAVVEELKSAGWSGVDGVLSVCPYYNKPSQEGLYRHFKAIAEASPLPVVLYNVPGRTGVNLKAETTVRLARDCENIVAVKEASGSLEQEQAPPFRRDKRRRCPYFPDDGKRCSRRHLGHWQRLAEGVLAHDSPGVQRRV